MKIHNNENKHPGRRRWGYVLAVAFWLIVWHVGASLANRSLLIPLPTPVDTVVALYHYAVTGAFWLVVLQSFLRIIIGFLAALIIGFVGAVVCVRFEPVRILMAPVLSLIRSIPVASFTILVFLWVARGNIPTVISFFTVLPMIWATLENGLRSADTNLIEMGHVFGWSTGKILKNIIVPGIRPFFTTVIGNGLGFAWKSGVAAEVICRTQNSLGNLLWAGKTSVDYAEVFAVTLVIAGLSMLLQVVAEKLLKTRPAQSKN